MSVKVTDNSNKINQQTAQNASVALRLIASAIVQEATPKTPRQFGDLRNRILKQVLGLTGKIVWQMPYAGIQESKKFRNYTTPGTGPHFAQNAVTKIVEDSNKYFRQAGIV
jgi:hypothetical protein